MGKGEVLYPKIYRFKFVKNMYFIYDRIRVLNVLFLTIYFSIFFLFYNVMFFGGIMIDIKDKCII